MLKQLLLLLFVVIYNQVLFAQVMFTNQADSRGLNDVELGATYLGNGVSFVDFNNDGWDDLTFASGDTKDLLFFENNNGVFIESSWNLPSIQHQTKSVSWVDIDNDGDKDLYILSNTSNGNQLFLNQGNGEFIDITLVSGLPTGNLESYSSSWGDINNDGFLDVFICNRGDGVFAPNRLYLNNGDSTFQDISNSAGILNTSDLTFCAAFFDYNNDGWQDIYVINDKYYISNVLYKNNGDETFTDVSIASGANIVVDAMSSTIGDFNNDGWFDVYITNTPEGNVLLKNNGDETFTDIALASGTLFESIGWGSVFLDADNDRDLDLYVSGELDGSFGGFLSAAYYQNNGNETFTIPNNIGFMDDTSMSFSNAIGDIDNDGYPEIVVSNSNNQTPFLWKNETSQNNNWLKVKLQGVISNRDGIGSRIEISTNGNKQYRYTLCGEGYISQNSNTEFFGIGTNTTIDYVKVTWLSGQVDYLENVSANTTLTIVEGSNPLSIDTTEFKPNFELFPNPTADIITLKSNIKINQITLFNNLGIEVLNKYPNSLKYNLNIFDLASGIYMLRIYSDDYQITRKIIKK